MKINVKAKPYKGYIFFPRVIMLRFKNENDALDFDALANFMAFASECVWDRKKLDYYGCLNKTDEELAIKWGCDLSTVWRKKMKLKKLGLLQESESGLLRLNYFEWFEAPIAKELAKQEIANSQELIARTQELIASSQRKIADVQDHQGYNDPQSFNVSSKEDLSVGFNEDYKSNKDKEREDLERAVEEVFGDD